MLERTLFVFGMGLAVALIAIAPVVARRCDRQGAVLAAIGCCLFWNFVPWDMPSTQLGCGVPWKWWYEPGYVYTGMMEPSGFEWPAFASWRFDLWAGLSDIAVAAVVVAVWYFVNEVQQRVRGNRPLN